ncbi:MAG: ATP-binding protein [Clostridia bacterium]|jgi:DNA replication protein DnaC|nr:ATP-binding protein [Clostridia bacterium]
MTNELQRYYSELREKNRRLLEKRIAECEQKNPRFRSLANEPGLVFKQLAAGKLTPAAAKSRIGAIGAERRNLLISMGLPGNYLDAIYTCPRCQDTGEVGEPRRLCACALKKQQEQLLSGSRINDRETFANFNEAIYPNDEQKKQGLAMKRFCERYVASLPSPEKPNLLIVGQSGLGKSFFGNAIARAAIEKGIPTLKTTAYQCIQTILDGIETRADAITPYLSSDFLILDDLGTEAMVPNVTVETVFRILNERTAANLPTVLITNLDREGLFERYGERVASRMIDGALTAIVLLRGDNLRTRVR